MDQDSLFIENKEPKMNLPVVIVGGSLNGLTAALLLAHRKVPCIVVEKHPGTSLQFKFNGISPRSMEIHRGLGIEAEIRENRTGDQKAFGSDTSFRQRMSPL
jgi:putative polyketide hydroxylase